MNTKPISLLWFGDAACVTTGFGRVASNILGGLYDTGKYDIRQLGLNYYGDPHNKPYDIFPARTGDPFGRGRLKEVLLGLEPDVFITNNDIWALDWIVPILSEVRQETQKPIPWIAYFPIDGGPLKQKWLNFIKAHIDIPVTYTKWARHQLNRMDKDFEIDYVYHGVDTSMFSPNDTVKKAMREQLSEGLGREIDFTIGYVGRNQPRKRLPELLVAYGQFVKENPNALLYLHTPAIDRGWNLKELVNSLKIPKNTVAITPNLIASMGIDDISLGDLYRFFDVFCLPTVGEGFGLPLIEGMASGCAIVSTDCSVVPEIVGDAGLLVNAGHNEVMTNDNEFIRPIPSVSGMKMAFDTLYHNPDVLKEVSEKGVERAKTFDNWNIDFWVEKIKSAEELINRKKTNKLDFDLDLFEEVK